MLKVFLCEDDAQQRIFYGDILGAILQEHSDMETQLILHGDPLSTLQEARIPLLHDERHLYFLDIHLAADMDGIQLAHTLRQTDPACEIVFLTTDGEQMPLTFRLQLKALDYILKNDNPFDLKSAFKRCIEKVLSDSIAQPTLTIEAGRRIIRYPFKEVMFICTSGKKGVLELHTENSFEEYRGTIKGLLAKYPTLLQVHQGILVNPDNIAEVDDKNRFVLMANGEQCELAHRYRKKALLRILQ